ncbi:unnamed protein product [Schistosoma mattheei]|uniref:Uncharacterized protein n=1 Tax=Schistosoma mattheei TaxID=31246 RepID=A0A3P8KFC2_9TREM|nr:unnamed protein product [Schistosoma mattheei]
MYHLPEHNYQAFSESRHSLGDPLSRPTNPDVDGNESEDQWSPSESEIPKRRIRPSSSRNRNTISNNSNSSIHSYNAEDPTII